MRLNKNDKLTSMVKEITTHKEYALLTRLLGLKISINGAVCGMVNDDGVIHSITLTPLQVDFGFASEYRLYIRNTQTGDSVSFDGSINSIRTILGMDTIYTTPVVDDIPHISLSNGYTDVRVFKKNIVCISVVDTDIKLWIDFTTIDRNTQIPVHVEDSDMILSFRDDEYDNIKLSCATMNNLVVDLIKEYDDECDLY